jgi:hypothetical protein
MPAAIPPPGADEFAEFHKGYLAAVAGEQDALDVLERQWESIEALRRLTREQSTHRYAEGKWSVAGVIGHVADSERVLSYRLLRIARGDETPLPGFDEKIFAAHSNADERPLDDLLDELAAVRASTLTLVRSLDANALIRRGLVNNWNLSVRALAFIIPGHFQHHLNVLRERYGVVV